MAFTSEQENRNLQRRHRKAKIFARVCAAITWASVLLLAVLLYQVCVEGLGWLDWDFLNSYASRVPTRAGIKAALVGTFYMIVLIAVLSILIGISAALYLEEFAGKRFGARGILLYPHGSVYAQRESGTRPAMPGERLVAGGTQPAAD